MSETQITVVATDTQGKTYIFDKPTQFDAANDPFLFGLERGKKEAAEECIAIIKSIPVDEYGNGQTIDAAEIIKEKFGLEI